VVTTENRPVKQNPELAAVVVTEGRRWRKRKLANKAVDVWYYIAVVVVL